MWVGRALYEQALNESDRLRAQLAEKDTELRELRRTSVPRETYATLFEQYHALKLRGATDEPEPTRHEAKAIDPVTKAIIAKSRNSPILRKQFSTFVIAQRHLGASEDEIAQAIENGQVYDGGIPG